MRRLLRLLPVLLVVLLSGCSLVYLKKGRDTVCGANKSAFRNDNYTFRAAATPDVFRATLKSMLADTVPLYYRDTVPTYYHIERVGAKRDQDIYFVVATTVPVRPDSLQFVTRRKYTRINKSPILGKFYVAISPDSGQTKYTMGVYDYKQCFISYDYDYRLTAARDKFFYTLLERLDKEGISQVNVTR